MTTATYPVKPFLRWAGGKRWIAGQLAKIISPDRGTYFEPFLGGGSLYFAALPEKAVLSDINPRLVETYQVLRDYPQSVIDALEVWTNDERSYYEIRETEYADPIHRVAQFIYLNRTCWNGLYRVNRKGKFNVPFGNHGRPVFDARQLMAASTALQNAEIRCGDFAKVLKHSRCGDFVYLDPPYVSSSKANGFSKYTVSEFSWDDQQRLGRTALSLAKKGCHVLASNISREDIIELYPGFSHRVIARHSILAAKSKFRGITKELLLASKPELFRALDETC